MMDLSKLTTADKVVGTKGQHVCLFGDSGVGKTYAAAMLAKHYKLLWFDLENGSSTIALLPPEIQKNIYLVKIPDTRMNYLGITAMLKVTDGPCRMCAVHGTFNKVCIPCHNLKQDNMIDFDVNSLDPKEWIIVVDSGTQLSNSAMAKTFDGQDIQNVKPEYDNYTAQGVYLDRVFNNIQQSPANYLIITHAEIIAMSKKGASDKLAPKCGTRAWSRQFGKYFDASVYMQIRNNTYDKSSSGLDDQNVTAKSRLGVDIRKDATQSLALLFPKNSTAVPLNKP